MARIWDQPIDKHTDWGGDSTTQHLMVSGKRVQEFIKGTLEKKFGCVYHDETVNKIRCFADEESRLQYYADPYKYKDNLLGEWEAEAPYRMKVEMITPSENIVFAGSTGNEIIFTATTTDKSGGVQREGVTVLYEFVSDSGQKQNVRKVFNFGQDCILNVDDLIQLGGNTVTITVQGRQTGASTVVIVEFQVYQVDITIPADIRNAYTKGIGFQFAGTVTGGAIKYVEQYIDGVKHGADTPIAAVTGSFYCNITAAESAQMSVGDHTYQCRAYIVNGDTRMYTQTLYRNFTITAQREFVTNTMLSLQIAEPVLSDDTLKLVFTQYSPVNIPWKFYDSYNTNCVIAVAIDGKIVTTVNATSGNSGEFRIFPTTYGEKKLTVTVTRGEQIVDQREIDVTVNKTDSDIYDTEGYVMDFNAAGRSNSEAAKDVWIAEGSEPVQMEFHNVPFSNNCGWHNNESLRLVKGSSITLPAGLIAAGSSQSGVAITIDYMTENAANDDVMVAHYMSAGGFDITATQIKFQASSGTGLQTRFRDNERHHATMILDPNPVRGKLPLYLVIDGVFERLIFIDQTDTLINTDHLNIGGDNDVIIYIYGIRVYRNGLTIDQAFNNYVIASGDVERLFKFNDIYQSNSTDVSYDKVSQMMPTMVFTGPINVLEDTTSKDVDINCDVDYRDPVDETMNFTAVHARMKLQGTSSLGYPRKNFKLYVASKWGCSLFDYAGEQILSNEYSHIKGSIPCNKWTLKADYMDSSCSHNAGTANLMNDVLYNTTTGGQYVLRTLPQQIAVRYSLKYQIRTTPQSHTMCCFWHPDESSDLICLGQYNFLNDKGNEEVYGFKSQYDNPVDHDNFKKEYIDPNTGLLTPATKVFDNTNVVCFEGLNNTTPINLFHNIDDWDKLIPDPEDPEHIRMKPGWSVGYEMRYPEQPDDIADMDAEQLRLLELFHQYHIWVANCWEDWCANLGVSPTADWNLILAAIAAHPEITPVKFSAERDNHIYTDHLAGHFVYFNRFAAVDQVVKNVMWVTYDGIHWETILYDNDTILGVRNDGRCVFNWDVDRESPDPTVPTDYAFAGHNSALWCMLTHDQNFNQRMMEIDRDMYGAGGLTQANVLAAYDNISDSYPQRLFNDAAKFRYFDPFASKGINRSELCQGTRKSHRHWFVRNRFDMFDAKWLSGAYTAKSCVFKAPSAPEGTTWTITAARASEFGWARNKVPMETGHHLEAGESWSPALSFQAAVGDPLYLYGVMNMSVLDVSNFRPYLSEFDITQAFDEELGSRLRVLRFGSAASESRIPFNTSLKDNTLALPALPALEELDIRGYKMLTSIPMLGSMTALTKLYATDSGLVAFTPADGQVMDLAWMPSGLQTLSLQNTKIEDFRFTPDQKLMNLTLWNDGLPNRNDILLTWVHAMVTYDINPKLCALTMNEIYLSDLTIAEILKICNLREHNLQGVIDMRHTPISDENIQKIVAAWGDESIFNSEAAFFIATETAAYIQGPALLNQGESGVYYATTVPSSLTNTYEYSAQIDGMPLPTRLNESTGHVEYYYLAKDTDRELMSLDAVTGRMTTHEASKDYASISVTGTIYDAGELVGSVSMNVQIKPLSYPTSVDVRPMVPIKQLHKGSVSMVRSYDVESWTGTIVSEEWEWELDPAEPGGTIVISGNTITVTQSVTVDQCVAIATFRARFGNGQEITGEYILPIIGITPMTGITIDGEESIVSTGDHIYKIMPKPTYATEEVKTVTYTTSISGGQGIVISDYVVLSTVGNDFKIKCVDVVPDDSEVRVTINATAITDEGKTFTASRTISIRETPSILVSSLYMAYIIVRFLLGSKCSTGVHITRTANNVYAINAAAADFNASRHEFQLQAGRTIYYVDLDGSTKSIPAVAPSAAEWRNDIEVLNGVLAMIKNPYYLSITGNLKLNVTPDPGCELVLPENCVGVVCSNSAWNNPMYTQSDVNPGAPIPVNQTPNGYVNVISKAERCYLGCARNDMRGGTWEGNFILTGYPLMCATNPYKGIAFRSYVEKWCGAEPIMINDCFTTIVSSAPVNIFTNNPVVKIVGLVQNIQGPTHIDFEGFQWYDSYAEDSAWSGSLRGLKKLVLFGMHNDTKYEGTLSVKWTDISQTFKIFTTGDNYDKVIADAEGVVLHEWDSEVAPKYIVVTNEPSATDFIEWVASR